MFNKFIFFISFIIFLSLHNLNARDYLSIAGSSTVLPFATIVAEQFGKNPNFKTPVVESGGSSVGKKGVCDGIGTNYIDIGNASSRMKLKELAYCESNGIKVTEIKFGYDGIVIANSKKGNLLKISKEDLGKALTAKIPCKYVRSFNFDDMCDNPFKTWKEVNPNLPDLPIRVYGPPTTSGTRASWVEIVNEKGFCKKDVEAKRVLKIMNQKPKVCRAMRTDGAFIEAGEQDNLIVQKLIEDPHAFGIFGFSYLDQNTDAIQGAVISDFHPTFDNITLGKYPVSRSLWFYVKLAHLEAVPGIKIYLNEWVKHWGEDGLLSDSGMIPMSDAERDKYILEIKNFPPLTEEMLK